MCVVIWPTEANYSQQITPAGFERVATWVSQTYPFHCADSPKPTLITALARLLDSRVHWSVIKLSVLIKIVAARVFAGGRCLRDAVTILRIRFRIGGSRATSSVKRSPLSFGRVDAIAVLVFRSIGIAAFDARSPRFDG